MKKRIYNIIIGIIKLAIGYVWYTVDMLIEVTVTLATTIVCGLLMFRLVFDYALSHITSNEPLLGNDNDDIDMLLGSIVESWERLLNL